MAVLKDEGVNRGPTADFAPVRTGQPLLAAQLNHGILEGDVPGLLRVVGYLGSLGITYVICPADAVRVV